MIFLNCQRAALIKETELIMKMGFDGKSVISPKQISIIHNVFTPSKKDLIHAIHVMEAVRQRDEGGVGVLVVDGKMVDIAWVDGAKRVLELAKAAGTYKLIYISYEGDLV